MKMNKKIMALEGLRGIAFLGVFLSHSNAFDNRLSCLGAGGIYILNFNWICHDV